MERVKAIFSKISLKSGVLQLNFAAERLSQLWKFSKMTSGASCFFCLRLCDVVILMKSFAVIGAHCFLTMTT